MPRRGTAHLCPAPTIQLDLWHGLQEAELAVDENGVLRERVVEGGRPRHGRRGAAEVAARSCRAPHAPRAALDPAAPRAHPPLRQERVRGSGLEVQELRREKVPERLALGDDLCLGLALRGRRRVEQRRALATLAVRSAVRWKVQQLALALRPINREVNSRCCRSHARARGARRRAEARNAAHKASRRARGTRWVGRDHVVSHSARSTQRRQSSGSRAATAHPTALCRCAH